MDIVINILGILKYIGIGIIAFFAFAIIITKNSDRQHNALKISKIFGIKN